MPKWEVRFFDDFAADRVKLYVWYEDWDQARVVLQADGTKVKVPPGTETPPTLILPSGTLEPIANAISELGVKTDSDAKLQGTMEAQRAHLADLRQLLKLK